MSKSKLAWPLRMLLLLVQAALLMACIFGGAWCHKEIMKAAVREVLHEKGN